MHWVQGCDGPTPIVDKLVLQPAKLLAAAQQAAAQQAAAHCTARLLSRKYGGSPLMLCSFRTPMPYCTGCFSSSFVAPWCFHHTGLLECETCQRLVVLGDTAGPTSVVDADPGGTRGRPSALCGARRGARWPVRPNHSTTQVAKSRKNLTGIKITGSSRSIHEPAAPLKGGLTPSRPLLHSFQTLCSTSKT